MKHEDCIQPAGTKRYLVVESFTPCECHTAIIARGTDWTPKRFLIMFVQSPRDISFGDTLFVRMDRRMEVVDTFLQRGKGLCFRLILDDIPGYIQDTILEDIVYLKGGPYPNRKGRI